MVDGDAQAPCIGPVCDACARDCHGMLVTPRVPTVIKVDGGGSGICDGCNGRLDYSWRVTWSDGMPGTLCMSCIPVGLRLPAIPADL
jgi:hypothetical protein